MGERERDGEKRNSSSGTCNGNCVHRKGEKAIAPVVIVVRTPDASI